MQTMTNRWPPARRVAWLALFWAIFSWAVMVEPNDRVYRETLPVVGWIGV